jgi:hypothetical protein
MRPDAAIAPVHFVIRCIAQKVPSSVPDMNHVFTIIPPQGRD